MKSTSQLVMLVLVSFLVVLTVVTAAQAYQTDGDEAAVNDYYSQALASLLKQGEKRSCIRRGGSCDNRPNDCCYQSSCKCHLWGSNCRCQRMGLFQKLTS